MRTPNIIIRSCLSRILINEAVIRRIFYDLHRAIISASIFYREVNDHKVRSSASMNIVCAVYKVHVR